MGEGCSPDIRPELQLAQTVHPKLEGGRGCPLFSLGIAVFPAHHLMYRFPKSWIGVGGGGGRSP